MLHEHDWLQKAQALAVGMRVRVRHGRESRENMVIANAHDKWWAYCQRCHEGAVVQKEHVMLGSCTQSAPGIDLTIPKDIAQPEPYSFEETTIARYLAKKHMDYLYFPEGVQYSQSRKRIMVQALGGWHGRDITDRSTSKWLNYSGQQIVGSVVPGGSAVVVEDLFSWFKVRWVLRGAGSVPVCALGTQAKPALVQALMKCERVLWFFDADAAGDAGAEQGMRRLAPFVQHQRRLRPPDGMDPKDMDLRSLITTLTKE